MPAIFNNFLFLDSPLKGDDGSDKFFLRGFSGQETISQMFVFHLDLLSSDFNVDSKQVVGKEISFGVQLPVSPVRFRSFNGTINRFALIGSDVNLARYQAVVVPEPWFLSREFGKSIFQNATVPEIVERIISDAQSKTNTISSRSFQLDNGFVRRTDYRKREYCVMYDETALNFIMRLMEDEGICFYFKHEPIGAGQDVHVIHKMLLLDSPDGHQELDPSEISFNPSPESGKGSVQETITSWMLEDSVRSKIYSSFDFDFKNPNLRTALGTTQISDVTDVGRSLVLSEYPGGYLTPDQAEQSGKVRIREEEEYRFVVTGTSSCSHLASGFLFNLKNHPRVDQNGRFLITSVSHNAFEPDPTSAGGAPNHYGNKFTCIPFPKGAIPYRPPRISPKPRVFGCETAIVAGPKGDDDIYTDEFGRIKVQFHWDLGEQPSEKSSCFIRVGTPWAGTGWGAIHIPRIDQEVIVAFLYGDPDQPIIVGSVYNGTHAVPFDLPKNKTQSGIRSRSSPKGTAKNFNEISFEDKKGQERLLIHAERTMLNSVEASQFITVGGDRHIKTGYTDDDGSNHGDVKELVHNNHNLHVLGDQRTKIEGTSDLHVQKDAEATYDQGLVISVGQKCVVLADTIQLQGTTKIVLMAGASSIVIDASGVTVLGAPLINLNSPGAPPTPEIIPMVVDPDDP
jgi:type VI secretion system secreted protein VgrG